jgi:hypothetical protein
VKQSADEGVEVQGKGVLGKLMMSTTGTRVVEVIWRTVKRGCWQDALSTSLSVKVILPVLAVGPMVQPPTKEGGADAERWPSDKRRRTHSAVRAVTG